MSLGSSSHSPPRVRTAIRSISSFAAEVSTNPPLPAWPSPCALISPRATSSPLICPFSLVMAVMLPPAVPSAPTLELSVSSIFSVARRKIRPPSSTTLLAFSLPLFLTTMPAMPMRPASAVISPRLVTLPAAPVISTLTPGEALSIRSTFCPAARMVSPCGVVMMPEFETLLPSRYTLPPIGVVIWPWLTTLPAPRLASNLSRLARKSPLVTFSVLATKAAASMRAPAPTKMPAGLTSQTRPLEVRLPRMTDGSLASTRLRTLLDAEGWTNRAV